MASYSDETVSLTIYKHACPASVQITSFPPECAAAVALCLLELCSAAFYVSLDLEYPIIQRYELLGICQSGMEQSLWCWCLRVFLLVSAPGKPQVLPVASQSNGTKLGTLIRVARTGGQWSMERNEAIVYS